MDKSCRTFDAEIWGGLMVLLRAGVSSRKACKEFGIGDTTFYGWLDGGGGAPEVCEGDYLRARARAAHALFDRMQEVTEHPSMIPAEKQARLHGYNRIVSKLNPRRYGDGAHLEITGADGASPSLTITINPPPDMLPDITTAEQAAVIDVQAVESLEDFTK